MRPELEGRVPAGGFPVVRVAGSPRARGRQYGEIARERIQRSLAAYTEVFAHYSRLAWPQVLEEARRFRPAITAFERRYLEEIDGIAEGAAAVADEILALNVRTEIMYAVRSRRAEARPVSECSAIGVRATRQGDAAGAAGWGSGALGHSLLLAQNWDWLGHCFDTVVVLQAVQDGGPDYVTVVEAGLLAKIGLNARGVALATTGLVTDRDVGASTVPNHILLRAILDTGSVAQAVSLIESSVRSSSSNYLIADGTGALVDVEGAPGDRTRLQRLVPEAGVLVHTNHFLSPPLDARDTAALSRNQTDSTVRGARLAALTHAAADRLSIERLQVILRDHENFPFSICGHPAPERHPCDQIQTIASVVMDPGARRMWLASGRPCSTPYFPVALPRSFARGVEPNET